MRKKEIFKIETILSADVLGRDALSVVVGGTGELPVCKQDVDSCHSKVCNFTACAPNIVIGCSAKCSEFCKGYCSGYCSGYCMNNIILQ